MIYTTSTCIMYIHNHTCRDRQIRKSNSVMDYKPRYPQPFTLAEATALDVSVISEGRVEDCLKGNAIGS